MIEVVVKAAFTELSFAMINVETFLENNQDEVLLISAQSNMKKVSNLLTFVKFDESAAVAKEIRQYLSKFVVEKPASGGAKWDVLIDAFTGLDDCLKNCFEEAERSKDSLKYSQQALNRLASIQEQPIEEKDSASVAVDADKAVPPELGDKETTAQVTKAIEIEPALLEVFKEEVTEELAIVQAQYSIWKQDASNNNALQQFDQSLQTIKGCGYMAGAKVLGDYAKLIENILNEFEIGRLLRNKDLLLLLDDSLTTLTKLITNVLNREAIEEEVTTKLQTRTDALLNATNKSLSPTDAELSAKTTNEVVADKPKPAEQAAREIPFPMGEALHEIFVPEAKAHIETIEAFIKAVNPSSDNVSEELIKAIHTLHGSSHLAEMELMAALSGELETYCNHLFKHPGTFNQNTVQLLQQFVAVMTEAIAAINTPKASLPNWQTLLEDIKHASKDILQSTLKLSKLTDEEKITSKGQDFLANAVDSMAQLNRYFTAWVLAPDKKTNTNKLAEILTKLKQNAVSAQLTTLVNLINALESFLKTIPVVDDDKLDLIHEGINQLEYTLDNLHLNLAPPDVEEITEKLQTTVTQYLADQKATVSVSTEKPADTDKADNKEAKRKQVSKPPSKVKEVKRKEEVKKAAAVKPAAVELEDNPDAEMLGFFLEEADEIIERLEEAHADWLSDLLSKEALETQMRHLHTFKGGARLVGLVGLGDASHFLETLFEKLIAKQLKSNDKLLKLVRSTYDGLQKSVQNLHQEQPLLELTPLLEALKAAGNNKTWQEVASFKDVEPALDIIEETAEEVEEEAEAIPAELNEDIELIRPKKPPAPLQAKDNSSAEDKRIRVQSSLLDDLINDAGEITITQARMERKNNASKYNLNELRNTIDRLKRQLNTLNVETEAQIISRHQGEHEEQHDKAFDPLEMDRYSTLQQVSRALSETVNDLSEIGGSLDRDAEDTDSLMIKSLRTTQDLKDGLLDTRMVPFKLMQARFKRVVRETAQDTGKKAELEMEGMERQVDHTILDKMVGPIEHLLRNAVTHGVEPPAMRKKRKKPAKGRIHLSFIQKYSSVRIVVRDDGGGLDAEAIRKKAISMDLLKANEKLSDDELYQFVLSPGFSTAKEVSQIAGRGIGMNVVMNELQQLGGTIIISSEPGKGTSFTIWIPLVLSITEALLIEVANEVYAVPHGSANNIIQVPAETIEASYNSEVPSLEYAGDEYRLFYLGAMLGLSNVAASSKTDWSPVLLIRSEERAVAVQLDQLLGTSQIMVKSIGDQFKDIPWFIDGTLLSSGKIALLLDLQALIRNDQNLQVHSTVKTKEKTKPTIMIVDDSITVRKVTSMIFERHNMNVVVARDGVEAVAMLQEQKPDVMLLDIEMPRMNGYELAQHMMHSDDLKDIPIIMITSRSGEKHRKRALELGVKHHIGKPFKEDELLAHVDELLEGNNDG